MVRPMVLKHACLSGANGPQAYIKGNTTIRGRKIESQVKDVTNSLQPVTSSLDQLSLPSQRISEKK